MSCQRTGKIKNRKDENLAAFRLRYVFPTPKPYSFQDVFSHSLCQFQGFFPGDASGKELAASAGDTRDMGLIPGSGRSPKGRNGNPLQYSCLGNPMDRGA